jgi:hypothetical protein
MEVLWGPLVLGLNHLVENDSHDRPEGETREECTSVILWRTLMDTSASLKELLEEDLDTVSAGKNLHFGNIKLHFGHDDVVQINIATQYGVAFNGVGSGALAAVAQFINQSNVLVL